MSGSHKHREVLSTADLSAIRDVIVPLALEVGRWARSESAAFHSGSVDLGVSSKTSPGDVVTRVDVEAQRLIAERLTKEFPGFGLLGEESGLSDFDDSAPVWVIDPVDGTHNFVRNYPSFCVSIGLVHGGHSRAGAIYDAGTDEVTSAFEGGGAFVGARRLSLDADRPLSHALITTNFTAAMRTDAHLAFFGKVAGASAGVRASGSACKDLLYVAESRVDLFWQFGLNAWDVAAGAVIVREAGGEFRIWQGGDDWLRKPLTIAAGSRAVMDDVESVARDFGLLE